jgi:hypothetical protein
MAADELYERWGVGQGNGNPGTPSDSDPGRRTVGDGYTCARCRIDHLSRSSRYSRKITFDPTTIRPNTDNDSVA